MQKIITKRPNGTIRVKFINTLPEKTDQTQKKMCDVNEITSKYIKANGKHRFESWMRSNPNAGTYTDIVQANSLMEAFEIVKTATDMFNALPSAAREKFKNDPLVLEQWLADPKNNDEAVALGLRNAPPSKSEEGLSPERTPSSVRGKSKKSAAGTPPAAETEE